MPDEVIVFVPTGMRSLTDGERIVTASGRTVGEVIDDLETSYPGFYKSLVEDGRLRSGLMIAVNSVEQPLGLLAKVPPQAELHILPAMAGGARTRRHLTSTVDHSQTTGWRHDVMMSGQRAISCSR